jgi:hypothetical protein
MHEPASQPIEMLTDVFLRLILIFPRRKNIEGWQLCSWRGSLHLIAEI